MVLIKVDDFKEATETNNPYVDKNMFLHTNATPIFNTLQSLYEQNIYIRGSKTSKIPKIIH